MRLLRDRHSCLVRTARLLPLISDRGSAVCEQSSCRIGTVRQIRRRWRPDDMLWPTGECRKVSRWLPQISAFLPRIALEAHERIPLAIVIGRYVAGKSVCRTVVIAACSDFQADGKHATRFHA